MQNTELSSQRAALAAPASIEKTTAEDVRDQCKQAQSEWENSPGRNIVLLFDGTGNVLGNQRDTNIVRLLRAIEKSATSVTSSPAQLVYYDPGVGTANTFPVDSWLTKFRQTGQLLKGMALGSGAFENIAEAYEFLVRHYQHGDRIFLFGFSRGAFTARAVGGMINAYGLVQPTALPMISLMLKNYFANTECNKIGRNKIDFSSDIIDNFSLGRRPLIHFTGVFDTVETIGSGFLGGVRITNPATIGDKRYVHVRHAVSMHELRCKYRPRLYTDPKFTNADSPFRSFEERWFSGAHSDVGGSYARDGLSVLTLQWMVDAAIGHGLLCKSADFVPVNADRTMHDESYESPFWVWTGLSSRNRAPGSVIDASALSIHSAKEADSLPRKTPLLRYLGWFLTLALIVFGLKSTLATGAACISVDGGRTVVGSLFQLFAPWHSELKIQCSAPSVLAALRWDWWFILVYFLWMPYPISWALRRHATRGIEDGRVLSLWLAEAQWFMLALVVSDVVENLGTYWLAMPPAVVVFSTDGIARWIIAASAVIKFIALGTLIVLVASGCIARRRTGTATGNAGGLTSPT